jgi:hypothetical protein
MSWAKSWRSQRLDIYLSKSDRWYGLKVYRTRLGRSLLLILGKYSFQVVIRLGEVR